MNSLRNLSLVDIGPWDQHAYEAQAQLFEVGIRPGDIICRLGNAYVYGTMHISKVIANITSSCYSHAGMVIDVDDRDILMGDVDTKGLRRQYFVDWIEDARSDISVLRFVGDEDIREEAVNICKAIAHRELDFPYDLEDRRFCCVELICWCYREAGAILCNEVPINKMPGWHWYYYPLCVVEGVDYKYPVWCVGNKDVGLMSSPLLQELVCLKQPTKKKLVTVKTYSGA